MKQSKGKYYGYELNACELWTQHNVTVSVVTASICCWYFYCVCIPLPARCCLHLANCSIAWHTMHNVMQFIYQVSTKITKRMDTQTLGYCYMQLYIFPVVLIKRSSHAHFSLSNSNQLCTKKGLISTNETPGSLMNNQSEADLCTAAQHFHVINIYTTGHILQGDLEGGRNWLWYKTEVSNLRPSSES